MSFIESLGQADATRRRLDQGYVGTLPGHIGPELLRELRPNLRVAGLFARPCRRHLELRRALALALEVLLDGERTDEGRKP